MSALSAVALRIGFVAVALVVWFWSQRAISRKAPQYNGVGDRVHDWTAQWHAWLVAHPRATDRLLIGTSVFIDIFGVYLLLSSIFGPTLRPFLAILILFALRQACQMISTLPVPPGSIWRHPGFPSLLVTYGTSNDFFFSGHTGISVLGTLQLAHVAPPWLVALGVIVTAAEALTVLVLRAHYTMDVFTALFAAWGADVLAGQLAPTVDTLLRHIT